jgi:hypothetical protein
VGSDAFRRDALAAHLAAPPRGLTAHADRLLAHQAGAAVDVDVAAAVDAALVGVAAAVVDVAAVAIVVDVAGGAGVDVDGLRFALLRHLLFRAPVTIEPWASVEGYWLARIGARPPAPPGPAPTALPPEQAAGLSLRALRFAHHSHLVFFAANYGADVVDDAAAYDAYDAAGADVDVDCADSVASLLLAAECLQKRPACDALWARLGALQAQTGALSTSTKTPTAAHHAACVAALAYDLRARRP